MAKSGKLQPSSLNPDDINEDDNLTESIANLFRPAVEEVDERVRLVRYLYIAQDFSAVINRLSDSV